MSQIDSQMSQMASRRPGSEGGFLVGRRLVESAQFVRRSAPSAVSYGTDSHQSAPRLCGSPNTTKRLVKRPKYVFADSGLGLHLQAIRTHETLLGAPHFGHLFESFVIMEIRKLYGHAGEPWDAYFWRTPAGLECDLVLSAEGRLIPIEIKHAASLSPRHLGSMESFLDLYPRIAPAGILVSMHPRVERLSRRVYNVPLGMLVHGLPRPAANSAER